MKFIVGEDWISILDRLSYRGIIASPMKALYLEYLPIFFLDSSVSLHLSALLLS